MDVKQLEQFFAQKAIAKDCAWNAAQNQVFKRNHETGKCEPHCSLSEFMIGSVSPKEQNFDAWRGLTTGSFEIQVTNWTLIFSHSQVVPQCVCSNAK